MPLCEVMFLELRPVTWDVLPGLTKYVPNEIPPPCVFLHNKTVTPRLISAIEHQYDSLQKQIWRLNPKRWHALSSTRRKVVPFNERWCRLAMFVVIQGGTWGAVPETTNTVKPVCNDHLYNKI